jgi:hypothetical protein
MLVQPMNSDTVVVVVVVVALIILLAALHDPQAARAAREREEAIKACSSLSMRAYRDSGRDKEQAHRAMDNCMNYHGWR